MSVNRRDFLKATGFGLGGVFLQPLENKGSDTPLDYDSAAMLYDSTICVGCKACQVACKQSNELPAELDSSGIFDAPERLTAKTWTLIELYKKDALTYSFVKKQCMHCVEPACVTACPVGALEKTEAGPVVYHSEKCIGCRYCMAACPYEVPKYQWDEVFPLVQKCDFCADRIAVGLEPACAAACPTGALIFGKRGELLEVAKKRIKDSPNKYVDHIYGEREGGGTAMLYLSHVPFNELGFPDLEAEPLGKRSWPYLSAVPGLVVGVGGLMTGIYWTIKRRITRQQEE